MVEDTPDPEKTESIVSRETMDSCSSRQANQLAG
jgi:hypothetical protein